MKLSWQARAVTTKFHYHSHRSERRFSQDSNQGVKNVSSGNYYIYALIGLACAIVIAFITSRFSKKSAENSGRSATQAETSHKSKYKIMLTHKFELKEYSFINGGYSSLLTIFNSGEVTVTAQVNYSGEIELFKIKQTHMVDTPAQVLVIKPGDSVTTNIDILTGGLGGHAKLKIHCLARNTHDEQELTLGNIDEILRERKSY